MKLSMLFIITLISLKRDFKRSFLTMLGIIIGIASIITIVALGDGYKKKIIQDMTKEENENIVLEVSYIRNDYFSIINEETYYNKIIIALLEELKFINKVEYTYSNIESNELIEFSYYNKSISGIVSKLGKIKEYNNIIGRNINELDIQKKKRVVVLCDSILKSEFNNCDSLLGKLININNLTFEVIGIIKSEKDGLSLFSDYDEIQIPITTYKKYFQNEKKITGYNIILNNDSDIDKSKKIIENTLNNTISTDNGKYHVNDTGVAIKILGNVLNTVTVFIALVAGISLFIAGIGNMNMSYTLVSERTLEIGIKRAIGAHKNDIKKEFLLEGIFKSIIGGIIGYLLSIFIANMISAFMNMVITPNLFTVLCAIIISSIVGILSSVLPASKASKANTIDILK